MCGMIALTTGFPSHVLRYQRSEPSGVVSRNSLADHAIFQALDIPAIFRESGSPPVRRSHADSVSFRLCLQRCRVPSQRAKNLGQVAQRSGEVREERVGTSLGELTVGIYGLLDRGQGLLPPPHVGQAPATIIQRPGEVGEERVGTGFGELTVDVYGLLGRGQGLLPPPQVTQAIGLVVQRPGQVGEERVGTGLGELPADGDRLLDRG